ncbi:MAG TPA: MerR family transcriptional regulator [Actinocrinis sp.]|uniref:MerR family transcriptional regulator n=1 Tax=Actinocrinis sp. TaxID=1920516 RepID=UPI002DDDA5ED|nr:MerR family transcriptional regulator [Actinocrinis sp.]HEV2343764.1 MerR family transcriptional regulator [Actinocrinis sp.]
MLTISQLADYVGVTVRAVRHYHQRGLLAEPERDASGYRRYDAQAVIDLIRIKTLADAGVPLARIDELLAAEPERFARAVARIDRDLAAKIRDLKEYRRRIAQLAGGERLFLPQDVVEFLDELRALGVSERAILLERDGWIMLAARYPEAVATFIANKRAYLRDADFRRFYLAYDQAFDWEPDDPRIERLADEMFGYFKTLDHSADTDRSAPADTGGMEGVEGVEALLAEHYSDASPGWIRLNELATKKMKAAGMR